MKLQTLPLSEANILSHINDLQQQCHNTVEVFQKLKEMLPTEKYKSIESNYIALYMYDLIKNKTPLDEFEKFIVHLFNDTTLHEYALEQTFSRFLQFNSTDISFEHYSKFDKYNNNFGVWNNLQYLFYDLKNDHPGLDNSTLPYLKSIVTNINEKAFKDFGIKFSSLYFTLTYNFEDLIPILKLINNNKSFEYFDNQNNSFIQNLLSCMRNNSYGLEEDIKTNIYQILCEHLNDFNEQFNNKLCGYDSSKNKFCLDYGLVNYHQQIGMDKLIDLINNNYQIALAHRQAKIDNNSDNDAYLCTENRIRLENNVPLLNIHNYKLAYELYNSLDIAFKNYDYVINTNKMDTTKTIYDNIVYLKLLEVSILKGNRVAVPEKVRDYIVSQLEQTEEQFKYNIKLFDPNFKKHLLYISLEEKIPLKKEQAKKIKI